MRIYFLDSSYIPGEDDGSIRILKGDEDEKANIENEQFVARFPGSQTALAALDATGSTGVPETTKDAALIYAAEWAWSRLSQPIQNVRRSA